MFNTTHTETHRDIVFPDSEPTGAEPPQLGVDHNGDGDPFYYGTGSGTKRVKVGDALALKFTDHRPGQIAALLPGLRAYGMLKTVEIESGELTTADLEALSGTQESSGAISDLRLVVGTKRTGRQNPSGTVRFQGQIDWSVLKSARQLDVHGVEVSDEHLNQLGTPSRLRILHSDGTSITPRSLDRFDGLLALFLSGNLSLGSDLSFLRRHQGLGGFNMRFSGLTSDQFGHISGLPGMRIVDLGYNNKLGGDLSRLEGAMNLQLLELSGTAVDGRSIASLRWATQLTHLILQTTNITDADLSSLRHTPGITNLNVAGNDVTDTGLRVIVESLPNLRYLDIRGTAVTDHGMRILSGAKGLFSLGVDGELLTVDAAERLVADTNLGQVQLCEPYGGDDGFGEWVQAVDIIGAVKNVGRPG